MAKQSPEPPPQYTLSKCSGRARGVPFKNLRSKLNRPGLPTDLVCTNLHACPRQLENCQGGGIGELVIFRRAVLLQPEARLLGSFPGTRHIFGSAGETRDRQDTCPIAR